jgi:hypothetical protein
MKQSQNTLVWLRKLVVAQQNCTVSGAWYEVAGKERSASAQRVLILTAAARAVFD